FTLGGKLPIALTAEGMKKVRNREMDVTANMDKGDFSLILLAGWAKKASGNMDFSAHVGGTLDDPDVTLDLDLNKCQLVPPMVAQSIDDLSGRIKVRHNRLAVEDLNARIGQGRVFITSPPVDESKMVLVDFIPQYLDFRVQTIGTHGLFLSIPTIMRKGEWGEIYFYGNTPNDPMVIRGPLTQPVVSGTALLDTGHYTFPPIEALDEHGQKIEYRELAGVTFDLKLVSGKNTWYSNDFNSCYLELKVDPGDVIKIEGKDADRTPEEAGIKCYGTASTSQGWLIYLNHRFDMQNGWIAISKGHPPSIWGKATSRLTNVAVVTAGGVRQTDVDSWVDFKGTFGKIDFQLDSNPKFDPTDPDKHQKMLLSYIMFGRDMTGYTSQQLQTYYQQSFGQTATETAASALNTIALNEASRYVRSYVQQGLGMDIQFTGNPVGALTGQSSVTAPVEAGANSLPAQSSPLLNVELVKPLDSKFSVRTDFGLNRGVTGDLSPTGSVGLDVHLTQKLKLSGTVGQNEWGQQEGKVGVELSQTLPDVIGPKKGDVEKPNFERFDVFPVGPGKFSIQWVTDKVTKCEVRVLTMDGQLVKVVPENKPFDYRHDMTIDGLDPAQDFLIQISAKDPNGNERIKDQKAPASIQ
ncbi:MAG TPA: translocation/assembly module TamB domain-containing protein, partial [bacterium]|nr:translocation/assembly module TamB domain-containing protein [bacterium]